jgi:2-succinyl-5-enolpyruvyl-6-hydroxy-3-cyclohexene-1-carboxylate synthase
LDPSVIVMAENTANLTNQRFLNCIDRTIEGLSEKDKDFEPDFLLQIGGAIVSKKIKNLLRTWKVKSHWRVSYDFPEMDTFRILNTHLAVSPSVLIKQLVENGGQGDELFYSRWKQRDFLHQEAATRILSSVPFSDLKAFETVLDFVPDFSHLHLANSSVVRYSQLFDPIQTINYHSNRGTSGIDGSLSTAVGASIATRDAMHVCITGDISFLYDSNALWNKFLKNNLRIVVINNGGGGIFKIIPGPSTTNQKNEFFFAENESVDLKKLTESFGLTYTKVQSVVELEEELTRFFDYFETESPKLMEIDTRQCPNDELLKKYFKNLV